jgi:hypothetical protein
VYYDAGRTSPLGGGGFYHKQVGQTLVFTGPESSNTGIVIEVPCT